MRKILTIVVVLIGLGASAQYVDHENRFNESSTETSSQLQTETNKNDGGPPGNPGAMPIDDYVPSIMFLGIGLILLVSKKKQFKN